MILKGRYIFHRFESNQCHTLEALDIPFIFILFESYILLHSELLVKYRS